MSQRFDDRPSVLYENRYCDQNEFNIIISNESKVTKDFTNCVIKIYRSDVKLNVVLIPMLANRSYAKRAVIGSDIFLLGRSDIKLRKISQNNLK